MIKKWIRNCLMVWMGVGLLIPGSAIAGQDGISPEMLKVMHENGDISDETYLQLQTMGQAQEASAAKSNKSEFTAYWDKGLRLKTDDNAFKINFGGRILNDWASVNADDQVEAAFPGQDVTGSGTETRQARFYMSGIIYDRFRFNAEYDFAGTDADFTDVWIGMTNLPWFGEVRVGHQKEPFSLERMNSLKYTVFIERALPVIFAPGRNTGVKFHNAAYGNRLGWGVGAYKETKTSDGFDDMNNYNITARLTGTPWMTEGGRQLLHLGLNYSHKFSDEDQDYRYRMFPEAHVGTLNTLDTGTFGNVTDVDLVSPEIALVLGSFSVQSEYVASFLTRENEEDIDFSGYYVFCSYFLTGEHRKYGMGEAGGEFGRVVPRHPFSMDGDGWGSWEVALRYSSVDLNDHNIAGGEEDNYTAGINWYLNANLRWSLNYVRTELDSREVAANDTMILLDDDSMDTVLMRFQVDF